MAYLSLKNQMEKNSDYVAYLEFLETYKKKKDYSEGFYDLFMARGVLLGNKL